MTARERIQLLMGLIDSRGQLLGKPDKYGILLCTMDGEPLAFVPDQAALDAHAAMAVERKVGFLS